MDAESDYVLHGGILYSTRPVNKVAELYPRLMLPKDFREKVIKRCHLEVGHAAQYKTMERIRDSYVWPAMRAEVQKFIEHCNTCCVHTNRTVHTQFHEMPLPASPMQVIGIDLIGPFVESWQKNKYVLTVINHCTG